MKSFKKIYIGLVSLVMALVLVGCTTDVTKVESITLVTQPKAIYEVDENINLEVEVKINDQISTYEIQYTKADGVKVRIKGTSIWLDVSASGFVVTGLTTATQGSQTATLTFSKDGSSANISFNYEVKSDLAAPLFAGGTGTQNDPFIIVNREQMFNIGVMHKRSNQYYYYKVGNNVTEIDASNWTSVDLWGSFDGNGVEFTNINLALFNRVISPDFVIKEDPVVIENFKIRANIRRYSWTGVLAYGVGVVNPTFKNIEVNGYVSGDYGVSLVAFGPGNFAGAASGYVHKSNFVFENVVNNASFNTYGGNTSGFIAHAMATTNSTIKIKDSIFKGDVFGPTGFGAKYVVGNFYGGSVTFEYTDGFLQEHGITSAADLYKDSDYKYNLTEKITRYTTVTNTSLPELGEVFKLKAVANSAYAVFTLTISPNGVNNTGNFTGNYINEVITLKQTIADESYFVSALTKHFTVRVNPEGVAETGADGAYFNIVNATYGNTLGSNTTVKVIQFDTNGNILQIDNISFNDK